MFLYFSFFPDPPPLIYILLKFIFNDPPIKTKIMYFKLPLPSKEKENVEEEETEENYVQFTLCRLQIHAYTYFDSPLLSGRHVSK